MSRNGPPSLAWTIFLKEMRETLRDRRVIISVVVSPLLLPPIILSVALFFAGQKVIEQELSVAQIGLLAPAEFPELVEHIESSAFAVVTPFQDRTALDAALSERAVRVGLVIPENAYDSYRSGASAKMEILYDGANEQSEHARKRLKDLIKKFGNASLEKRLQERDINPEFLKPMDVTETNLATASEQSGFALSLIVPYALVIAAAFGGVTTAFDLCAGEKERNSLETLLVAPVPRRSIVLGKLLTVCAVSVATSVFALAGLLIALQSGLSVMQSDRFSGFSISYPQMGALLIVAIPLALLASAVWIALSSFARTQKEAQTFFFPFIILITLPAMLSSMLGAESPLYTAFIPILNIALSMKQLLGGVFDLGFFACSLASSLVYALIAMQGAILLFQREGILFRS